LGRTTAKVSIPKRKFIQLQAVADNPFMGIKIVNVGVVDKIFIGKKKAAENPTHQHKQPNNNPKTPTKPCKPYHLQFANSTLEFL
jgi:hypothetical protein